MIDINLTKRRTAILLFLLVVSEKRISEIIIDKGTRFTVLMPLLCVYSHSLLAMRVGGLAYILLK